MIQTDGHPTIACGATRAPLPAEPGTLGDAYREYMRARLEYARARARYDLAIRRSLGGGA